MEDSRHNFGKLLLSYITSDYLNSLVLIDSVICFNIIPVIVVLFCVVCHFRGKWHNRSREVYVFMLCQ